MWSIVKGDEFWWLVLLMVAALFHGRECLFTEMGRHKHCPEFGQVARNSFGIHGVVSKIPRILHHLHGSGLFSVLFETDPHLLNISHKCSIDHTHTRTVHTKGSSRNLKPLSWASNFSSEVWLYFYEIVVQHFFKVCKVWTQNSPAWKTAEVLPSCAMSFGIKTLCIFYWVPFAPALFQQVPV